jgi:hypothetical protein
MKKRTQAGGVNGPYNGRNRRKRKSEAARQSDFATFDSTLADDWPKTRWDGGENPRMRLRRLE